MELHHFTGYLLFSLGITCMGVFTEVKNLQRIAAEQEASNRDRFLQLQTDIDESRQINQVYKDTIDVYWNEDGNCTQLEKTTSTCKNQETIKIYKKLCGIRLCTMYQIPDNYE
ncbi:hypothetical protein B0J14DRAFT_309763 [Halenospora varia]|nr:hypothetical protein B0J14DRAFT_309763 [Halenospora varia]